MTDLPKNGNFIASEDLANRLNSKVRDEGSFSIIYLDLLNFRDYVTALPEEHQKSQREKALDHLRMAVVDEFLEEKISEESYIINHDSYRAGYDKLIVCINSDVNDYAALEKKLQTTVEGIISKIEKFPVNLVEGLEPEDVDGVDPRKIEVRAGVIFSRKAHVRNMLNLAQELAEDAKIIRLGYKMQAYDVISMAPGPRPDQ